MIDRILNLIYKTLGRIVVGIIVASILFSLFRVIQKSFFYPLRYKEEVFEYSAEYCVEKSIVFAVIKTESSFNKNAKSKKGALGLMQITEKTGEYISSKLGIKEYDLYNPKDNVNFGCYYLSYLFKRFKSQRTALIAYNAGEGNVTEWLANREYSKDGVEIENIPYKETAEYIDKIYKRIEKYKKLYRNLLDK